MRIKKKGFTLIELIFAIVIIMILSGILIDLLYNTLDYYDVSTDLIKNIENTELIIKQIKNEVRHSVKLESMNISNLNLSAYNSSDVTDTVPINFKYNFFNNKLYKYNSVLDDTEYFRTEFNDIKFNVNNAKDTFLILNIIHTDNREETVILKKRNK